MIIDGNTTESKPPVYVQERCPGCASANIDPQGSCACCIDCGRWFERTDPMAELMRDVESRLREIDTHLVKVSAARPNMTPDPEVEYFGGCPICHGSDGALNVERDHWHVCRRHLTRWHVGSNLFSNWKDESEWTHRFNAIYLAAYSVVECYRAVQVPQEILDSETVPF